MVGQALPKDLLTGDGSRLEPSQLTQSSGFWAELSADVAEEFFGSYPSYLRVDVLAESAETGAHRRWVGLAEASLARLLRKLERVPDMQIRPLPRCFHTADGRPNSRWECTAFFIGLALHNDPLEHPAQKQVLVKVCGEFSAALQQTAVKDGWHSRDMVLSCNCFTTTARVGAGGGSRVPASPFETLAAGSWHVQ